MATISDATKQGEQGREMKTRKPWVRPTSWGRRRYPFRGRGAEGRIQEVLKENENTIFRAILDAAGNDLYRLSAQTKDEIYIDAYNHLTLKSLPKYDAALGNKPATFIYHCVRNVAKAWLRQQARPKYSTLRQAAHPYRQQQALMLPAPIGGDSQVESLAAAILEHPERYLTDPRQIEVFKAVVIAGPEVELKEIAQQLGYKRQSSLSMIMSRIKTHLKAAADDLAIP
jgi:hypothetical protein